jgi:hypothetical protein
MDEIIGYSFRETIVEETVGVEVDGTVADEPERRRLVSCVGAFFKF